MVVMCQLAVFNTPAPVQVTLSEPVCFPLLLLPPCTLLFLVSCLLGQERYLLIHQLVLVSGSYASVHMRKRCIRLCVCVCVDCYRCSVINEV